MIKIENTSIYGWEEAIRGMRNPLNSWHRSDSLYDFNGNVSLGENDADLMRRLCKAGSSDAKFRRMIVVYADITCHHTWWAEFDTYKVGTVRNSCSKMHKIHAKEFVVDDFSTEGIEDCGGRTTEVFIAVINELERLRRLFNETKEKKYWRALIELLPMGFNLKATIKLNYEVLHNIYHSRLHHKLTEWREFCKWIESLPYSWIITGKEPNNGET